MKSFKKKDKWADLDEAFKDTANSLTESEIRNRVAKVSLDQAALIDFRDKDFDLKEKKEIAKEAGAIYREGTKANKLRIEYYRMLLDGQGKDTGSFGQQE
jgi:hypothetical protein